MTKLSALLTTAILAVSPAAAVHQLDAHHQPQPHVTRVGLYIGDWSSSGQWSWQPTWTVDQVAVGREAALATSIDPREYPAGTTWTLRLVTSYIRSSTGACWRLYDATVQQPGEGSQICHSAQVPPQGATPKT